MDDRRRQNRNRIRSNRDQHIRPSHFTPSWPPSTLSIITLVPFFPLLSLSELMYPPSLFTPSQNLMVSFHSSVTPTANPSSSVMLRESEQEVVLGSSYRIPRRFAPALLTAALALCTERRYSSYKMCMCVYFLRCSNTG